MRVSKFTEYAARLLLAVVIGLASISFLPATVQADTNPVDLVLGGAGATSWDISNIQPADNGTKTVELHNAGSEDGFVTIWLSDLISNEGVNPESETGDTAEPGELADYLLLGATVDGLSTNLNLPAAISNLPQSYSAPGYIEVIPLKADDTINLQWEWELPAQTANDVQGDDISFTINYLLRECRVTDVSDVVDNVTGVFTEEVTAESEGGKGILNIEEGTTGLTQEGESLNEIWLIEIDKELPALPSNTAAIGLHYDAGPNGTTFDRPITITFSYDPASIPAGVIESDMAIALWDVNAGQWVKLEGGTIDTVNHTISTQIDHFSRYTIIAHVPPPPSNIGFMPGSPSKREQPPPTIGEEEPATAVLQTNMLGDERKVGIGADGTLLEPLTLADYDGNFVVEIDGGSKITGSDGIPVTRIELTVVEESIPAPHDIVILSPIYTLTGYINDLESSQIDFNPPAKLVISYDPKDLPENAFPPFIANFTDEQGWVQIPPPPDSLIEIGKAKALLRHASLFTVMVKSAPPTPPLPAKFEVSNLTLNPRRAQPGQPIVISLTIANEGATIGSYELHLMIDGIVRAVKEVTLAPKSSQTVSFEVANLAVGEHRVKVAGLTRQFSIVSITAFPTPLGIDWLLIDLSAFAVVVAGLLVLYLVIRRSYRLQAE
ncbi:hypothetical protein ACFLWO_00830 [Chloroflexota bacterium]